MARVSVLFFFTLYNNKEFWIYFLIPYLIFSELHSYTFVINNIYDNNNNSSGNH
jgi:hypothetical protein